AEATANAQKMMDLYKSRGIFQRMRQAAACRRAFHDSNQNWLTMRWVAYASPGYSELADICAVRMELARRAGDTADFMDALEVRPAWAPLSRQQGDGPSLNLATTIELATLSDLEACLSTPPSKEWLDQVDQIMQRQCTPLPTANLFDGDLAGMMNMLRDNYLE